MMTFLQAAAAVATSEETRMGLWKLFSMGGWLMWPLLALGGVTIFIFVERFMAIRKASVLDLSLIHISCEVAVQHPQVAELRAGDGAVRLVGFAVHALSLIHI